MWKGPKIPYLHRQFKKGRWYTYYRRNGKYIPLEGEPNTAKWFASYAKIHDDWDAVDPGRSRFTIAAVIDAYQASLEFKSKAEKTQIKRRKHFGLIKEAWGNDDIRSVKRPNIVNFRDRLTETRGPSAAREYTSSMKVLFSWATEKGLVDQNVATNIKDPIGYKAEPYPPWTEEEIETFCANAPDRWRRAVMVLLHTGLRLDDAVNIRRQNIKDGAIYWKTAKTGSDVVIPLTQALKDELARPLRVESMFLIAGLKGGKMEPHSVGNGIRVEFPRLGLGKAPPVHGLRKNAVVRLVEAGCEPREIQAITGQSLKIIEHYAQDYRREKLARAAVVKLEKRT